MHLWFQSTPKNLNAQINKLQHRLHILENNRYLNALGLAFLSKISLMLFQTLVRVFTNSSYIQIRFMLLILRLRNPLVHSISGSSRLYMNAKSKLLSWSLFINFLHYKVVVQQICSFSDELCLTYFTRQSFIE